MIPHNENVKQVFTWKDTINNTIQIILLILFYNVFETLKRKYMLNLTSSDEISEMLFCL